MDTEYEYDEHGNITKIHSVTVFNDSAPPCTTTVYNECNDDECEVETGVALDGVIETSPLETLLTAATGAFPGNVIYHVVKKLNDR